MKYLIVQDWPSTHDNHAGMVHMCDMLVKKYPHEYVKIQKSIPKPIKRSRYKLINAIMRRFWMREYRKEWLEDYFKICQPMFDNLTKGDEVFLLEYNWRPTSQYELAKYIKENYSEVRIYALSHITPTLFSKQEGIAKQIKAWDKYIDKQLTLGTSLSEYFVSLGIDKRKISTGKHYVDLDYYHKDEISGSVNGKPTIIAMGCLQRDYGMLAEIVSKCPNINWIICRGRKAEVDGMFHKSDNVKLLGYLSEDELRCQMDLADISLNVLEDTVGSNVITTSMAMGLVILTSDVGSIRDYCDESNAVLCENSVESFTTSIKNLSLNKDLKTMKMNSLKKSKELGIEMVDHWFNSLM